MSVNLSLLGGAAAQFLDGSGNPLTGGKVYTYAAGTTNPLTVYTTSAGNIAHTNPIILDAAGRVPSGGEIWLTDPLLYKFVVKNSAEAEIGTYDNISGNGAPLYTVLAASSGSSLIGFIQSGTGAVATTVQTKLRETISVKDFGAKGDYDPVTNLGTDDTAAIQAAITAAAGKKLIFPTATYKFTSPLSTDGIDIDFQNSELYYAGAPGFFALSLNSDSGSGNNQTTGNVFENITLYQSDFSEFVTVTTSTTWDPPPITAGAISDITPGGVSTTVSVPGATVGGFARATLSTLVDGLQLTAWVSAPDVVTVWLSKYVVGTVDITSGTLDITVVNNAYSGICIGGSLGSLRNAKVRGFTGVSFGVGGPTGANSVNGRDPVSGIMFGASRRAYYWDVEVNCAPAAGWAGVILPRSNENVFKFGTFPYNAYNDPVPRRAPTINQLVISGIGNKFQRTSLESSSSEATVLINYGSNQCDFTQGVYVETNSSYVNSAVPRILAQTTTSANRLILRNLYSGASAIKDLGSANNLIAAPSFYINGTQIAPPAKGRNLVVNGDFENGLTNWVNSSSGGFVTAVTGTGRISGKRVRTDLTVGRINLRQNIVTANGFSSGALDGCNITVCGWIKTNIDNVQLRINGLSNTFVDGDEIERFFVCTIRADSGCEISVYNAANRTGYVECSNITAYVGNDAGTVAERTQPIGSATYNPPNLNNGTQTTTTVTVTGAALGDFVLPSFSLDLQGIELTAYVSAADTVTCLLRNDTGGAIDLGSGTLRCRVIKA